MNSSSVTKSKTTSQPPKPNWILRASNQQPLENPKLRLLCIPHAGSGAFVYHAWNGNLPDGVEVLPIEVPGRNSRRKENPPASIADFANDFVDALGPDYLSNTTVPYALFGHSLGAWMAYAIVQELQQRNKNENNLQNSGGDGIQEKYQLPVALFVSGTRSPKLAGVEHDPDGVEMYKLDGPMFWQTFEKRYGKNPDLADQSVREFFRPKLQQDFKLGETYRPINTSVPLPCPLYVSVGEEDPRCIKKAVEAWKDCCTTDNKDINKIENSTSSTFQLRYFPGGHHYLLNEEESKLEFLKYLYDELNKLITLNTTGGGGGGGGEKGDAGVETEEREAGVMITTLPSTSSEGLNTNTNAQSSTNHQQNYTAGGGGGGGPGSVRSMSSDAGATVASGSSYAAGVGGLGIGKQRSGLGLGGANSGSMTRRRESMDGRSDRDDDLEGHEDEEGGGNCGNWKLTCCCF